MNNYKKLVKTNFFNNMKMNTLPHNIVNITKNLSKELRKDLGAQEPIGDQVSGH